MRKEYPSWLYPITRGATTIWERWDGVKPDGSLQDSGMNSFNHYAYGAIGEWLYHTVAGLDLDETQPGYKHILIRPTWGHGLTSARAELVSMYGLIVSGWRIDKGAVTLDVTIPANTTATITLPQANLQQVREGKKRIDAAASAFTSRQSGKDVIVQVGSGNYTFSYPME
jgi:alpha-L-rhamnosidase